MMIRIAFLIIYCSVCCSCSDSFINHSLEFDRVGDCSALPATVKVISNTNGERYELLSCLDEDFDGNNYTIERRSDSILVSFPRSATKKQRLFQLILDIDAKPAYHYILIDDKEIHLLK